MFGYDDVRSGAMNTGLQWFLFGVLDSCYADSLVPVSNLSRSGPCLHRAF